MNVLITSAGRRVSLLESFRESIHPRGGRVFAGDASALAPTLYLADDAVRLPLIREPRYLDELLRIVTDHSIRLIVPTIDTELELLANAREKFASHGCTVLISNVEFVRICSDKWLTVKAFGSRGVSVPDTWLPETLPETPPGELFVKPRTGSASQHTYATTTEALGSILPLVPSPVVQERLVGKEVTVDALLDFHGVPIHYVPRVRVRTVGGESIQSVTIDDDAGLREWLLRVLTVAGKLGAIGAITLQFFQTSRGPVLSEINPRFGGGFPLAYAAGADYPEWILQMVEGVSVKPRLGQYTRGLTMTRYYKEIFLEEPKW